jgi:amino acid adenylation domain-containing protein
MPVTALAAVPSFPSRPTLLEVADVALVQLPRDLTRAEPRPRTWAYAAGRELSELEPTLDAAAWSRLLAGVFALLARYSQQDELALDVAVHVGAQREARAGRVSLTVDSSRSFASLTGQLVAALQALPALHVRDCARRSNVAVTLLGQHASLSLSELGDSHDVHFVFHQQPSGLALLVAYDYGSFRATSIERWIDAFMLLSHAARLDDEQTVRGLPLLSRSEARALEALGQGPFASERDQLVHQRFQHIARERAQATALRFRGDTLSYGELDLRSDQLARYLVEAGVPAGGAVAVCLTPSLHVPTAILACLKAGVLYVPLDPSHPPALVASLIEDVAPVLALSDSKVAAALLPDALPRLLLDRDFQSCVVDADRPLTLPPVDLDQGAYVLYTSGTTGRPKGVVASQRNLAHYLAAARERFDFGAADVFCSLARYTFSISFFELLSPLLVGGELILLDRDDVLDPARLCSTLEQVSVLHAGPSLLSSLFRHLRSARAAQRSFPNLRHASSGGDLVGPDLLEEMKLVFPCAELFVIYGCTEIACMGTSYAVNRAGRVPAHLVGRPFADVTVRVLDADGRMLPFGVVGEVYFAGKGIARRYLNRPELSSERFVCIAGQRFYRTGDLGRLHDDGNLELLGRSDFQVQVRGIRIELPGIEATVRELGLARQCALIASEREAYDLRLVAFVVEPREADSTAFRRALAGRLPDYMLPQAVITLDALPLTANGKLDRKRLAELALTAPRVVARSAPESRHEIVVAEAFAKVLGLDTVGADADFFDLGGHSLSAVLLMEALHERLGLQASPGLLFSHPTVRGLAAALEGEPCAEGARPVLLNDSPEAPPLFLLLGVHLYREVARELEGQFAVYGVYADSELQLIADPASVPSVAEFARDYLSAIRKQQPSGPYRVGGMSFGGIVAYEVAQQLRASGEQVELLAMFDAVLPTSRWAKLGRALTMPRRQRVHALWQRLVARLSGSKKRGAPVDFLKYQDDAQLGSIEVRRQRAYHRSAIRYMRQIRPYQGDVTLVVAGERVRRDPLADAQCGFARLVPGLRVHSVRSEHLELLQGHGVGELLLSDLRHAGGRRCVLPRQPELRAA